MSADTFTGCHEVTGRGTLNTTAFTVTFVGTLCELDPAIRYTLNGAIQIYTTTNECAGELEMAASGTLAMFGDAHTMLSPNPIPGSDASLVSIVGSTGQIPICNP